MLESPDQNFAYALVDTPLLVLSSLLALVKELTSGRLQRIMIIDGAMGTVIQQYKLQVTSRCLSSCLSVLHKMDGSDTELAQHVDAMIPCLCNASRCPFPDEVCLHRRMISAPRRASRVMTSGTTTSSRITPRSSRATTIFSLSRALTLSTRFTNVTSRPAPTSARPTPFRAPPWLRFVSFPHVLARRG
eukprot:3360933-Rhodomonas_salina.2